MRQVIRFSHSYPKLWGQTTAELLRIKIVAKVNPTLREYDTRFEGGYYPLPDGQLIQLIFLGNLGIPFCTLRRYTTEKLSYYMSQVGEIFDIEVTG